MKDVKIQKAAHTCSLCGRPLHDITRHPSILSWMAGHDEIETPPGDPHDPPADDAAQGEKPDDPVNGNPPAPATKSNGDAASPSRVDVCPECWAKDHQLDYLCYWLARREPPKEKERKDRKGRNAFLRELFYHYYNNEHLETGSEVADDVDELPTGGDMTAQADSSPDEAATTTTKTAEELDNERSLHLYLLAHLLMRYKVFQWKGAKTDRKKRRWLQFDDPALGQTVKIADLDPNDPALAAVHQELAALLAE